jgi:uncharacterized peroxidase-related enzyme
MSRVQLIAETEATGEVSELYKRIKSKHGYVPNIFKAMGNSAAVLNGYLSLSEALQKTSLSDLTREKIALAVGEMNRCRYCLSAHSAAAASIGLNDEQIVSARQGDDTDPKVQAILSFVRKSVENRGWVPDGQLDQLKQAGVSEQELVEIVLSLAMNMFTNYFNHITSPEIDFPQAKEL